MAEEQEQLATPVESIMSRLAEHIEYQWRVKTFYADGVAKSDLKAGRLPSGAKGQFLAYIDARDVFDRLDAVVGPDNWHDKFEVIDTQNHVVKVTLTVKIGDSTVSKSDVGYPNSTNDEEPFKSSVSDGIKRAAVHFGIGRFLYSLDPVWVEVDKWGKPTKPIVVTKSKSESKKNIETPNQQDSKTSNSQISSGKTTPKTTAPEDAPRLNCEVSGCRNTVRKLAEKVNRSNHDGHIVCRFHSKNGTWKAALEKGVNPETGEIQEPSTTFDENEAAFIESLNNPQVTISPDGTATPIAA